jgi:hypothetical protein
LLKKVRVQYTFLMQDFGQVAVVQAGLNPKKLFNKYKISFLINNQTWHMNCFLSDKQLALFKLVMPAASSTLRARHRSAEGSPKGTVAHIRFSASNDAPSCVCVEHQVNLDSMSHAMPSLLPDVHTPLLTDPAIFKVGSSYMLNRFLDNSYCSSSVLCAE